MAIVDFYLVLCKHYQIEDRLALSLGSNLLPSFYQQIKEDFDEVV